MKQKMLALAFGLILPLLVGAQTTCPSWGPYVNSNGMSATGELLYTEVMAPSANMPTSTYWSSMDFHVGPRGGYCGIQNKTGNIKNNIFSVWDLQESNVPACYAEYAAPNTFVDGFAGEGTGLHTDNPMGWQPDVWYATAVRRWYIGDNKTRVGFFMYDYSTGKWKHYVTIVTPETNAMLQGNSFGGFLENFNSASNNQATSVGYYRNSWTMNSSGAFSKPTSYVGSGGNGYWNAESSFNNTAVKLTSCGIGQHPATYPVFNLNQTGTKPPTATPVSITMVTPTYANNNVTVNWSTNDYTSPQLSYTVKIFGSAGLYSTPVAIAQGIRPDTRGVSVTLPANSPVGTYWASVELVDIFNQVSNLGYNTFAVTNISSAGINTGIYYKIRNVASGLYLDVENASTTNNAYTPEKYSTTVTSQQWKFQQVGSKYFLINRNSGKLLTIYANTQNAGAKLIQYEASASPLTQYNQKWDMVLQSTNTYLIKSNMSMHMVVDNPGSSSISGTNLIIYPQNNPVSNNQLWVLEPVSNTLNAQIEYPFTLPEITLADHVLAYPNPIKKDGLLRFNLPASDRNYKIRVTTTTGVVIVNTEVNGTNPELSTRNMQSGIYLFTLQGADKNYNGKFVVE